MSIRVILADDHAIVLNGLKRLFDSDGDFAVVACCRDGDEALQAVQSEDADVLVLDMRMPGRSGLDVLRELEQRCRPAASSCSRRTSATRTSSKRCTSERRASC